MASQPDPVPSTPCLSTPLLSEASPSNADQELPYDDSNIVDTHGAYLITRPRTPVFQGTYNEEFVSTLENELNHIITQQIWRRRKYRDAADEWPIGRTPPEIKEKRATEVKAMTEQWNASDAESDVVPSPPISDQISETTLGNRSEDNEGEKATGTSLGKRRRGGTSDENEEDISVTILHKRQRRSTCEENEENNGTTRICEDKEVEKDPATIKYFPFKSLETFASVMKRMISDESKQRQQGSYAIKTREESLAAGIEWERMRQRRYVEEAPASTEDIVSNPSQQNERKRLRDVDTAEDATEERAIKVRITEKQWNASTPIRIHPSQLFGR
ncbi:hypothetical protein LSUE1_G009486 [Lachnellula suecica]|uniref:Uncharacterized protein n=1 Tax=Lachnellula suecica TaxID=602035 RepID=A0A8T9BXY2_9HELO|nr:hypothetical protein LSUE1_G009486 [Lachnellula suecica]